VFGENGHGNPPAASCKRVLWRDDHGYPDCQQRFVGELRRRHRPGSHHADTAAPFEHRLDHGARFDVEPQQRGRKFLLEGGHCTGENHLRKHDVHGHAQFRFKAAGQTLCPGFQQVDIARHRARIGEKRTALIRQHRKMSASIEESHAELTLEIGQGLAHHGLCATQAATGRRETAFIRGRNESAQLIQRYAVEHLSTPPITLRELHRLASWTCRHQRLSFDGAHRFYR